MNEIDEITGHVIDIAMRTHRELGPGLLESAAAFRVDLLVDNRLIVEIKSVETLTAAHGKQLLTYLRLTKQPVGLLINFAAATLKEGLRRVVNNYDPSASLRLCVNNESAETVPQPPRTV